MSANLADLEPDRVVGLHLNMVTGTRSIPDDQLTEQERAARERSRAWRRTGAGYQEIQGTRPQSLGYGLEDSPAGLAGWIVEKFREWSHGDLREAYTFDRLLDNVTAYWVTATATSSCRIYWEMRQAGREAVPIARILVPTAIAQFPGELSYPAAGRDRTGVQRGPLVEPGQGWPFRRHGGAGGLRPRRVGVLRLAPPVIAALGLTR